MHVCYILGACNSPSLTHTTYERANCMDTYRGEGGKNTWKHFIRDEIVLKSGVKDPNLLQHNTFGMNQQ